MRVLIVLACVFSVGFGMLFPSVSIHHATPSEFPKYLAQAKGALPAPKSTDHIVVTSAMSRSV